MAMVAVFDLYDFFRTPQFLYLLILGVYDYNRTNEK